MEENSYNKKPSLILLRNFILNGWIMFFLSAMVSLTSCKQSQKVFGEGRKNKHEKVDKSSLEEREAKISELEAMLAQKDSAVNALKEAVSKAMSSFNADGLTVEQKNGRVYISMEDRLLFASGSTEVDKRGVEAIKQLAKVLESKRDLYIVVEGHTDEVPITGSLPSGAKDNWDLSALRATSVVRIMTKSSAIDPGQIAASGRGPFSPLDNAKTAEARKKNRRTEIILAPKLDELFKILASE